MTESPEDVERLRARLRELEGQLAARDAAPVADARSRRDRQWWRSIIVVVLIVVAPALAPLTVVATWAHDQIGDTDRFVETVAPLASDPAVQNAIADRITQEIITRIDVEDITEEALTALPGQDFVPLPCGQRAAVPGGTAEQCDRELRACARRPGRALGGLRGGLGRSRRVQAHTQMVAVLTGDTSDAVDISDGAVQDQHRQLRRSRSSRS